MGSRPDPVTGAHDAGRTFRCLGRPALSRHRRPVPERAFSSSWPPGASTPAAEAAREAESASTRRATPVGSVPDPARHRAPGEHGLGGEVHGEQHGLALLAAAQPGASTRTCHSAQGSSSKVRADAESCRLWCVDMSFRMWSGRCCPVSLPRSGTGRPRAADRAVLNGAGHCPGAPAPAGCPTGCRDGRGRGGPAVGRSGVEVGRTAGRGAELPAVRAPRPGPTFGGFGGPRGDGADRCGRSLRRVSGRLPGVRRPGDTIARTL